MPYKISIIFPVQSFEETPDYLQLTLSFSVEASGVNANYSARNVGLRILEWGKYSIQYDMEDATAMPGQIGFVIGDSEGFLDGLLFSTDGLDVRGQVIIKLNGLSEYVGNITEDSIIYDDATKKLSFDVIASTDYLTKQILYDSDSSNLFNFLCGEVTYPAADAVYSHNGSNYQVVEAKKSNNELMTYMRAKRISGSNAPNATGTLTKVSGTGADSYAFNWWGNGMYINPFAYQDQQVVPFTSLLEKIYKLVNPAISYPGSLIVRQSWILQGFKTYDPTPNDGYVLLDGIKFTEHSLNIHNLFFNENKGVRSLMDLLKKIAIDWGCFTGMVHNEKAFFVELFSFDTDNLQAVKVLNRKKKCKYALLDCVRVRQEDRPFPYQAGTYTAIEGRTLERSIFVQTTGAINPFLITPGTDIKATVTDRQNKIVFFRVQDFSAAPGAVYTNNGSSFQITQVRTDGNPGGYFIYADRISGTNNPQSSGTLTKVSGTGDASFSYLYWDDSNGNYDIAFVKDPDVVDAYLTNADLIARLWYKYRGSIKNCRVDYFKLLGINYDFLKNFIYDGSKYRIIKMTKHYSQYYTEIEAIYLGAV